MGHLQHCDLGGAFRYSIINSVVIDKGVIYSNFKWCRVIYSIAIEVGVIYSIVNEV